MADLIDREGMLKFLIKQNGCHGWKESQYSAEWIYSWLESQDEVDAVEVVRCKYCEWYREEDETCGFWPDEGYRDPEHFCGEGKRRKH